MREELKKSIMPSFVYVKCCGKFFDEPKKEWVILVNKKVWEILAKINFIGFHDFFSKLVEPRHSFVFLKIESKSYKIANREKREEEDEPVKLPICGNFSNLYIFGKIYMLPMLFQLVYFGFRWTILFFVLNSCIWGIDSFNSF